MTRTSRSFRTALLALLLAGAWHMGTTPALAQSTNDNPLLLSPTSSPYGRSYGEWAAQWWLWTLQLPAGHNPAVSTDPALVSEGQSGPVWFLAGTFQGGVVERTVAVPANTALFLPVFNTAWLSFPTDPPVSGKCARQNYECLRELISATLDAATMSAEIDGVPVAHLDHFREESSVFLPYLPTNDAFGAFHLPSGQYGPSVDTGVYLMLAPMPPGTHVVHVAATSGSFSLDVTYYLTIG